MDNEGREKFATFISWATEPMRTVAEAVREGLSWAIPGDSGRRGRDRPRGQEAPVRECLRAAEGNKGLERSFVAPSRSGAYS